jgi:hypothetical protein
MVPMVLETAILTFTTGSKASGANLGKKKDAKSDAPMPASIKDLQICANLCTNIPFNR